MILSVSGMFFSSTSFAHGGHKGVTSCHLLVHTATIQRNFETHTPDTYATHCNMLNLLEFSFWSFTQLGKSDQFSAY
jgi:hypothetical protein